MTNTKWSWRRLFRLIARSFIFARRLHIRGVLPESGVAVIFASNHNHWLDAVALFALLPEDVAIVSNARLRQNLGLRFLLQALGSYFVEIDKPNTATFHALLTHLEQGNKILIFPEGKITNATHVRALMGVSLLAARSARPVLPVFVRIIASRRFSLIPAYSANVYIGQTIFFQLRTNAQDYASFAQLVLAKSYCLDQAS